MGMQPARCELRHAGDGTATAGKAIPEVFAGVASDDVAAAAAAAADAAAAAAVAAATAAVGGCPPAAVPAITRRATDAVTAVSSTPTVPTSSRCSR